MYKPKKMKALKIIGYVLLGIIGLVVVLGLIAPKEITTETSRTIEAPIDMVFNTVNDLKTWEKWSPWDEMDPDMKVTMGEKSVGEGAYYTWEGPITGKGKMAIAESTAPKSILIDLEFDGFGIAKAPFQFEETATGTNVTWKFSQKMAFPFNAMGLFMDIEGSLNKDYDRGLELLDQYVAQKLEEQKEAQQAVEAAQQASEEENAKLGQE